MPCSAVLPASYILHFVNATNFKCLTIIIMLCPYGCVGFVVHEISIVIIIIIYTSIIKHEKILMRDFSISFQP